LAYLTAMMIANGGTAKRPFETVIDDLYPMAAGIGSRVDKEMTVFSGTVHREKYDDFYALFREALLEPGFRDEDFERVKSDVRTQIETVLRRTDDEELGKEVLYAEIYAGHPYGHTNYGTLDGLDAITLDDVRAFHRQFYTPDRLTIGMAGGFSRGAARRIRADFEGPAVTAKPASAHRELDLPEPVRLDRNQMTIVQKQALATGMHIGFPIDVTRGHPDWPALWLVRSYLGEHRSENSHLYQRLRELRGLNYGDYAYIEYFPNGGSQFHPPPNVARQQQIFQIWLRPVPPENAPFAFKGALYELEKLCREGMTQQDFEATRNYLSKFVSLLVKTESRQLGYALDSEFYEIGPFADYVREGLEKLTLDDVNRVIREHLRANRMQFVVVTEDAEGFRDHLLGEAPTPITYQSKPSEDVLAEDEVIERLRIELRPEDVEILPVGQVFQR
ncbi:MAG: insulinase family protein, partial [Planctomycetes bacterium]|nr:insulinase family protein [Planctomycetota bacterium]